MGTRPDRIETFASRLNEPFGLAFFPVEGEPEWLYVADTDAVLRFPYRSGDLTARGDPDVVVRDLPRGRGHSTRDVAFSRDGKQMFISIGSGSNDGEDMPRLGAAEIKNWEVRHGLGAAWGRETDRAAVLVFDPGGRNGRVFAAGISSGTTSFRIISRASATAPSKAGRGFISGPMRIPATSASARI